MRSCMKSFNKRINKRKASKVTLKTHHKHEAHMTAQEEIRGASSGSTQVRSEEIKMHHN